MRAGAAAVRIYAMRAAIEHYRRAIESLEKLPDAPPEKLYDALVGWVQAAFRFSRYEDTLAQAERAVNIARSMGDKRRLVEALHWTANTHMATGHISLGIPMLLETLALAEEVGDEKLTVLPNFAKAFMMVDADPRGAIAQMDYAIQLAHKHGDKDTEATALAAKAVVAARLGEFKLSQEASHAAFRVVQDLNSPMTESDVNLFTAYACLDMGEDDQGLEYAQVAIEKALSVDRVECICNAFVCEGFGLLRHQNLPDAIESFREAIRRSSASGAAQSETMGRTGLALAEFFSGRAEAVQDMERTLKSAHALGDPYVVAFVSQLLGTTYTQLGELEQAEGHLDTALDYFMRNDMRPYVANTLQSLAQLYDRQGRDEDAARVRSEAEGLSQALQAQD